MHTHTKSRYNHAKYITIFGGCINIVLALSKITAGIVYASHSLIADGIHSSFDILIDCMVLFAAKYGDQEADIQHPYGHRRIETAATLIISFILILTGLGITWDGLQHIFLNEKIHPHWIALPIAIIFIIVNEGLFYITQRIGKAIASDLIVTNAWHHRADAAASVVVALAIAGSLFGYAYIDSLGAFIVGIMIIKMGVTYCWNCSKELIDTGLSADVLTTITDILAQIDGVNKTHQLRGRYMGNDMLLDLHVLVSPFISVSEGHYIAQKVHYELMKTIPRIKDITVHIDPEDDEKYCPAPQLPSRKELEQLFLLSWRTLCHNKLEWTIHYLDNSLCIDLFYPISANANNITELTQSIRYDSLKYPYIKTIRLFHILETFKNDHQ